MNKAKFVLKNTKKWWITTVAVVVFLFTATMILTQNLFLREVMNKVLGDERRVLNGPYENYMRYEANADGFVYYEPETELDTKERTLAEANRLNERIVEEGIVLLKNNGNALPLTSGAKISVFGKNSVNLVLGGSGSSAGRDDENTVLYRSLENAGFVINPTLKQFYLNRNQSLSGRGANPAMTGEPVAGYSTGETPITRYTDAVKQSYTEYADAAVVVISRIGGEGFDLPRTMKTSFDANARSVTGAGSMNDHYLELDRNEKALMTEVTSKFDKVIVLINSSTSMELSFLEDSNVDAALWIGSPGNAVDAIGKVVSGAVNPSGRLVDTFARDFTLDPTYANFSNNLILDGNSYTVGGSPQDTYFVEYEEGIYVGYRYWETRGFTEGFDEPFTAEINGTTRTWDDWYAAHVVYPFGYGGSYTTFDWEIRAVRLNGVSVSATAGENLSAADVIEVDVRVTNTGNRSGKEVVQLYYSAPYYENEIEKAHVVLGDFAKTAEIPDKNSPNNYADVTLTLSAYDMASYDYNNAAQSRNGFKGYKLDDGSYEILIAKNANEAARAARQDTGTPELFFNVSAPIYYDSDPSMVLGANDPANTIENRFDEVSAYIENRGGYLSRTDFEGTMPKAPTDAERAVNNAFMDSLVYSVNDQSTDPWYTTAMPQQGVAGTVKLYDLIDFNETTGEVFVDYYDARWDDVLDQITIDEMSLMIGTGGFNSRQIPSIGKPKATDLDSPSGFVNFMSISNKPDTCFYASGCVMGATYNKALMYDFGVMIGVEGIYGDVKGDGRPYSGWYAPAVNIHRTPFSGRNFEYYSEDGLLSGKMAAQVVAGAKSKGVYAFVKHFAVNDQETCRDWNGLVTWANEQSMREIYFKPFELTVKEGGTTAIMSSFNRIGIEWAGGSYALLTEVLRNEWGFKGMVISDYNLKTYMDANQMIRAGGDLNLTNEDQPKAERTATQVAALRQATKNILYTVAQSNAMNGLGDGVTERYAAPMWVVWLILANVGALVLMGGLWGFFAVKGALKKYDAKNGTQITDTQTEN